MNCLQILKKIVNDFNTQITNLTKLIDEARIKWHVKTRS